MINQYQNEIFPTRYYKYKIKNNNKIKEALLPLIENERKIMKPPSTWITNKLSTSYSEKENNFFTNDENIYEKFLSEEYTKCLNKFFDLNYRISISEIWYNYYSNDDYQDWHNHVGSIFNPVHYSCIHFLSFDSENHNPTVFLDPCDEIRNLSLDFYGDGHHTPNISEGDFIMFPSYLRHCVFPVKNNNNTNYPRITIAFNFRILQYGDISIE